MSDKSIDAGAVILQSLSDLLDDCYAKNKTPPPLRSKSMSKTFDWGNEKYASKQDVEDSVALMLVDHLDNLKCGTATGPDGTIYNVVVKVDLLMQLFINHYRHEDCEVQPGVEWEDQHSCMCNDRCPACGKEIEPYCSDEA
jgi:hypothetical protein